MSRGFQVLSVGRTRRGPLRDIEDDYLLRISRYAPIERTAVPASRRNSPAERQRDEAAALMASLSDRNVAIALDSRGDALSSVEFGSRLMRWRERGDVVFLIGGPDGLDPSIIAGAFSRLSLGPMTLPHELALVVLLEQIYRALANGAGHPYARH
ncbi:MAG: 23S rRNA (pseudouridine(1915)-N(3))-methyltransferase RlmH [Acidobacteriota bacterium]